MQSSQSQYMGKFFSRPITKNYSFPLQFRKKANEKTTYEKLQLKNQKKMQDQKTINNKNNIPPQYRCQTINFVQTSKLFQPKIYHYQGQQKSIKLKIVTYNIWFQSQNSENRYLTLLKLLQDSDADFICLQEATKQFLNMLQSSGKFKNYYFGKYVKHWYDTVILSKYQCVNYKIPFQKSFMERSLLISQLLIEVDQKKQNKEQSKEKQTIKSNTHIKSILIASVHFQSLDNTEIRISQLKQTFYYLSWTQNALLCGDFNFTDGSVQNQHFPKDFKDLYLQKDKKASQQLKFKPKEKNRTMLKTPKYPQWRPDHILVNQKGCDLQKSNIEIIGDFSVIPYENQKIENIEIDGIVRTPSDHLGLIAQIHFK